MKTLKQMASEPIVFAMANPTPEIMPEDAAPYVAVMAPGARDYPNQINNVLCFPGIFRGALDCRARRINEEMKLAAAHAIAGIISETSFIRNTSSRRCSTNASPKPSLTQSKKPPTKPTSPAATARNKKRSKKPLRCGFAAAQCGKALPFRRASLFFLRLRLRMEA